MFGWSMSAPEGPDVGGETAEMMHRMKDEILLKRAALIEERAAAPSVSEFYAGRNVFLTGGSGFLGRLVVEMLLRTCPDIGKVYLVLRGRRGVSAEDRLERLLDVALFDRLRDENPEALNKIVVLPGDIMELGLGLSEEHQDLLRREVSVVFHLAASVRFDDPFRQAVFCNLRSTREIVQLARGMPQLKVLVHVSTAYTNINREPIGEFVYQPDHDWQEVIRWAEELETKYPGVIDNLGPKVRGFQPNTYTFTKALAEKLIEDVSDELPVIISRPSIVVSTHRDPIPGWIDNLYGLAGFWAGGCKGVLRVFYGDNVYFDSIPADVVTKITILASWHRGLKRSIRSSASGGEALHSGAEVVNVTVMKRTGISIKEMSWLLTEKAVGRIVPYPGAIRPPKFTNISCKVWYTLMFWYHHLLYGFILDLLAKASGIKPRMLDIYRKTVVALTATAPFQKEFIFTMENQKTLYSVMNPKDERDYCVLDMLHCRDSEESFTKECATALRGILKHTLKEEDNPEKNWRAIVRLKWVMAAYNSFMASLLFLAVFYSLKFKWEHSGVIGTEPNV